MGSERFGWRLSSAVQCWVLSEFVRLSFDEGRNRRLADASSSQGVAPSPGWKKPTSISAAKVLLKPISVFHSQ